MNSVVSLTSLEMVNPVDDREQLVVPTIHEVVNRASQELFMSLLSTGVAAAFTVTPLSLPSLFAMPIVMAIFNTIIRRIPILIHSKITSLRASGQNKEKIKELEQKLAYSLKVIKVVCPLNFAMVDINTRGLLVHEGGHCIAASVLYQNAKPLIKIYPAPKRGNPLWFFTGEANWSNKEMTTLGQTLGRKNSHLIAAGAGTGCALISIIAMLTLSHKNKQKHPERSRYLLASAIATTVQHIFYALSAFWQKSKNHDFRTLWEGGVHPLVSVAFLALPLLSLIWYTAANNFTFYETKINDIKHQTPREPSLGGSTGNKAFRSKE